MKICASPPNTGCRYQRIARDQAPNEPDNGAQADPDAVQQAYQDLYECLASNNDTDALELLKHLMNALTGDGAMDEPMPFSGRPNTGGTMDPTTDASRRPRPGAMDAQIRRGRAQASSYTFNNRFPGAGRIRVVG